MQKLLKPLMTARSKSIYSVFSVMVVTIFSTWAVFDGMKTEVVFAADGQEQTVKTDTDTVGELLDDLGIEVGKHDELSHGEKSTIEDGMKIELDSADKILLTIDGETEEYHTTAKTVGEFFREESLTFSKHDEISHTNIEVLRDNIEIEVEKAFPVAVKDGKEEKELWTTGGTVNELLEANDISVKKKDKVKPGLDKQVKKDMEVSIVQVKTDEEEVEESIPFETEEEDDDSLEKGETRTVTEGKEGTLRKTFEITYENGKEANREVVDEEVIEEEQNEVIAIGTKEVTVEEVTSNDKTKTATKKNNERPSSKSENKSSSSPEPSSSKVLTMEATAYGPDCAGCSGVSATGMNLKSSPTPKVIAVDPSVIPLGSRVWVEGYGEAIAGDTGGAINGNKIDVLFPTEAEAASSWGRRTVQVKILD